MRDRAPRQGPRPSFLGLGTELGLSDEGPESGSNPRNPASSPRLDCGIMALVAGPSTIGLPAPMQGLLQRTRHHPCRQHEQEDKRWEASSGRRLLCHLCEEPITADEFRIAVAGSHLHTRINPAGIRFEFGCFSQAPGAAAHGTATREHTWFPGRRWRFSVCGTCGEQLGWLFEGSEPPRFLGLIGDRLVPEEEGLPPM